MTKIDRIINSSNITLRETHIHQTLPKTRQLPPTLIADTYSADCIYFEPIIQPNTTPCTYLQKTHPTRDIFFPDTYTPPVTGTLNAISHYIHKTHTKIDEMYATYLCSRCPIQRQCLTQTLAEEQTRITKADNGSKVQIHGITGATTPQTRAETHNILLSAYPQTTQHSQRITTPQQ